MQPFLSIPGWMRRPLWARTSGILMLPPPSSARSKTPAWQIGLLSMAGFCACAPAGSSAEDGLGPSVDAGASGPSLRGDAGRADADAGLPMPEPNDGDGPDDGGTGGGGAADGGSGDPMCGAAPLCSGARVTLPIAVVLEADQAPRVEVAGQSLQIGESTRAEVEAALGSSGPASEDPGFRAVHCAPGLILHYVDDVTGSGALDGGASPGDVLARVVTLPGAEVTVSNGVTLGAARATELAKLSAPVSYDLDAGYYDVSPMDGLALASDASATVRNLTLFRPQAEDRWGLRIDVADASLSAAEGGLRKGDSFATATTFLGAAYDREGTAPVPDFDTARVQIRSYASLGVRLAGGCLPSSLSFLNQPCDETNALDSIVLAAPFQGQTDAGLRLGSTEAEVEAQYGVGMPAASDPSLVVYAATGGEKLGIVFVTDSNCERRVAAFVLGYTELPN